MIIVASNLEHFAVRSADKDRNPDGRDWPCGVGSQLLVGTVAPAKYFTAAAARQHVFAASY
jgi:hypothetical protein